MIHTLKINFLKNNGVILKLPLSWPHKKRGVLVLQIFEVFVPFKWLIKKKKNGADDTCRYMPATTTLRRLLSSDLFRHCSCEGVDNGEENEKARERKREN